jgi:hypothetical protein
MAGIARKTTPAPSLLPSPEVIQQLSKAGLSPELLTQVIIEDRRGKQKFAEKNAIMGGACFIIVVIAFIYLVMEGHEKMAGVLIGTEALAIIKQMFGARL